MEQQPHKKVKRLRNVALAQLQAAFYPKLINELPDHEVHHLPLETNHPVSLYSWSKIARWFSNLLNCGLASFRNRTGTLLEWATHLFVWSWWVSSELGLRRNCDSLSITTKQIFSLCVENYRCCAIEITGQDHQPAIVGGKQAWSIFLFELEESIPFCLLNRMCLCAGEDEDAAGDWCWSRCLGGKQHLCTTVIFLGLGFRVSETQGCYSVQVSMMHSGSLFLYAGDNGGAFAKNSHGNL